MYHNTAAEFRPELLTVVQDAQLADEGFIADKIFVPYPVKTRAGEFMRIKRGKGQLLATEGSDGLLRAPGTEYKQTGRTFEQATYKCKDRGIEEPMDDVNTQDQSRFFDVESATSIWLARNVRIALEQRVAATVQDESIWGKVDAAVTYSEANLATFDFANDLKKARRQLVKRGERPNTLVMSLELWDLVTSSALLRQYFFGDSGGNAMITTQMVAEKFRLSQILLGEASYSTAKKGKDSTDSDLSWCWGNANFWIGNVQGGAPEMGGAGRSFVLEDLTNGGELLVVETYRDEKIRSDRLRVRQDTDENVINETSGLLVAVD